MAMDTKAAPRHSSQHKDGKNERVVIECKDVWKVYKMGEVEVAALRGLDLQVRQGEFVAIMGPSGSGKSTAMNMIGCLDTPSKGNIYLLGKNIAHMTESDLAQIRGKTIGFIFQKFNLINTLTALENVMLPMTFQDLPFSERIDHATKLLTLVDLQERLNHKPGELSGGQQQRVAIARALGNKPDVILADEPTGNLDSKSGEAVMEFLTGLHDQGKTIILVTHDPDVASFADKIYTLKDGTIVNIKGGRRT
jgi:putative ABC transport system ATP-binding protein